jgi:hypothetical protein
MTNSEFSELITKISDEDPPELPPPPKGAIRFVCLSDTHQKHNEIDVPNGDVLIHGKNNEHFSVFEI